MAQEDSWPRRTHGPGGLMEPMFHNAADDRRSCTFYTLHLPGRPPTLTGLHILIPAPPWPTGYARLPRVHPPPEWHAHPTPPPASTNPLLHHRPPIGHLHQDAPDTTRSHIAPALATPAHQHPCHCCTQRMPPPHVQACGRYGAGYRMGQPRRSSESSTAGPATCTTSHRP